MFELTTILLFLVNLFKRVLPECVNKCNYNSATCSRTKIGCRIGLVPIPDKLPRNSTINITNDLNDGKSS